MSVPLDCSALEDLYAEKEGVPEVGRPGIVATMCMLFSTAALVFIISVHMPPHWNACVQSGIVAIIVAIFVTINHYSLRHC